MALEGISAWKLDTGGAMSNCIELGARKNTGDGEEGAGADMAAEIRYVSPESGWEIERA